MNKFKRIAKIWVFVYGILAILENCTGNVVAIWENNMPMEERIDDGRDEVYMNHVLTIIMMNIRKIYLYTIREL